MVKQFLPTISSLVALGELGAEMTASAEDWEPGEADERQAASGQKLQEQRAETEWQGALTSLRHLLEQTLPPAQKLSKRRRRAQPPDGVMLSGPFPVFDQPELTQRLSSWVFVPQPLDRLSHAFSQLMPAEAVPPPTGSTSARVLPLVDGDPLVGERFCLLLTQRVGVVLVLGRDAEEALRFQFSFIPEVVVQVWRLLRSRIRLTSPQQLEYLDPLIESFTPTAPDYRIVSQFSRWLLSSLPAPMPRSEPVAVERIPAPAPAPAAPGEATSLDTELLKAMAHEIRTPLTTIRTLTRSLMRRSDMADKALQRLRQIDSACTQQIDRFNLIYRAVELEAVTSRAPRSALTATALSDIIQEAIPQWEQAATRRNLSLDVKLPKHLPMVASDPILLQQVLTGLVELFTHSVPTGGQIHLQVMAAGDQLKLEFQAEAKPVENRVMPSLKSLGRLLMFQPDTGGLSLNLQTTKALFAALGAKLTVRERPNQGTAWMVFLPIETANYPIV